MSKCLIDGNLILKTNLKKRGWYICSIRYGEEKGQAYVMDLFWDEEKEIWKDNRRINVFNLYKVLGYGSIMDNCIEKRLYYDNLCERTDVIAFKKLPKIYKQKMILSFLRLL